jgi:hypothetical protein
MPLEALTRIAFEFVFVFRLERTLPVFEVVGFANSAWARCC